MRGLFVFIALFALPVAAQTPVLPVEPAVSVQTTPAPSGAKTEDKAERVKSRDQRSAKGAERRKAATKKPSKAR